MSLNLEDLRVPQAFENFTRYRRVTEQDIIDLAVQLLKAREGVEVVESIGVTFHEVPEGMDGLILAVPSRGWDLKTINYLLVPLSILGEQ